MSIFHNEALAGQIVKLLSTCLTHYLFHFWTLPVLPDHSHSIQCCIRDMHNEGGLRMEVQLNLSLSLSPSGCVSLRWGVSHTGCFSPVVSILYVHWTVTFRLMRSCEMVFIHLFLCLPRFRRPYTSVSRIRLMQWSSSRSLDMSMPSQSWLTYLVCNVGDSNCMVNVIISFPVLDRILWQNFPVESSGITTIWGLGTKSLRSWSLFVTWYVNFDVRESKNVTWCCLLYMVHCARMADDLPSY